MTEFTLTRATMGWFRFFTVLFALIYTLEQNKAHILALEWASQSLDNNTKNL